MADTRTSTGDIDVKPAEQEGLVPRAKQLTSRAKRLMERLQKLVPLRAMKRFSASNGQVLAAGTSYLALFAVFAAFYVAFAIVGVWVGGNPQVVTALIDLINGYLPGVIGADGIVSEDAIRDVASQSLVSLGITGLVAIVILLSTAIGWIAAVRTSVRDIFGLPADHRNALLLKLRDLAAAGGFAVLLLVGAVLGWAGSAALEFLLELVGFPERSLVLSLFGRVLTIAVTLAINAVTLWMLFRFMTGTSIRTRDVLPGSVLGAVGITVLQLAFGFLVGKAPSNPLLVTFAVLIGLLLWIRLVMTVILIAAAWVAESAEEHNHPIQELDEHAQAIHDADLLVAAAELRVREAQDALATAGLFARISARRRLARARESLEFRRAQRAALD